MLKLEMKKVKEFIVSNRKALAISLFCVILLLLAFFSNSNLTNKREATISYSTEVVAKDITVVGYIVDGNFYKQNSSDPQLYIPVSSEQINDVTVRFTNKVLKDFVCQIFYDTDNTGLNEAKSVRKTVNRGEKEVFISLPESAVYSTLRIDIDASFELEKIILSKVESSKEYKSLYLDVIPLVVWIVVIVALLTIYSLFDKEIHRIIASIKRKYFSSPALASDVERKRAETQANLFALIALVSGFLLVFLMAPLTVPDEQAHFLNVLKVSHFNFFPIVKDGAVGTYLTKEEAQFFSQYFDVHNAHMDISNIPGSAKSFSPVNHFFNSPYVTLNPFAYIVAGLGLAFVRFLIPGLSVYSSFLVARMMNLLFYIIVVRLAIKHTPIFRNTMFMLALMPMTLHQCASTSYDALLIPCAFLLFAFASKIILADEKYRICAKDIIAVCFACVFLFCTKAAYAPLILILLSISIKKFGNLKKYFSCIGAVVALFVLFYVLPTQITSLATSTTPSVAGAAYQQTHKEYLLANLGSIPSIVIETTKKFSDMWREQFFGMLGWLDIKFPEIFISIFMAALGFCVVTDACTIKGIKLKTRVLSLLGFIIFFSASIIFIYINHNDIINIPVGGHIAYGFQGRYFIPAILFAFIALSNPALKNFKYNDKIAEVAVKGTAIISSLYAILTVFVITAAYWM